MSIKMKTAMKGSKNKKFQKSRGSQKNSNKSNSGKKRLKRRNIEKDPPEENPSPQSGDSDINSSGSSDVEEEYEKAPRLHKYVKVRNLLPVKNKGGVVYRSQVVAEEEEEEAPEESVPEGKETKKNLVQSYAVQQQCLKELKRKVALLCTSLIEEPDNNMVALKELVSMLQNPTTKMIVSERKILCLSLLHVFQDILPSYRLRAQEDKDKKQQQKLKKDTRKLMGFEQTLLKCYTKYVDLMYDLIREMKSALSKSSMPSVKQRAAYEVGLVAVKCMCELLSTRFNFNYFKNIANKLVPLSMDVDDKISNMCCQAFENLFRADKLGEAAFSLVKQIIDVIKERKFNIPVILLRTFLSLNLREAKVEVDKIDMNKGRKEWQAMSRAERQNKKRIKDLEAELKEAQAYESVEAVKKFHTTTLNKIFWVFFHILKDGQKVHLIAPALEGLSRFAYLINLEFFDDLNSVLCSMMESGKLTDVEKLHGVYTLFTILAGQAESLHIDPHRIYCHMYQGLLNLSHAVDVEHFDLTLKCLEFNILRKKKKISASRILAFTKRVSTVCLQTPVHGTLGLLGAVRNILTNVKGSDILLDSESTLGSGLYLPEVDDPEHCNPQSTAMWELHLLKKHYNPAIKLFSQHLLHGCPSQGRFVLPDKLAKSSPEETLHLFAEVAVKNKMDFMEDAEEPPKKKIKFDFYSARLCYEDEVELEITEELLEDVNFIERN